MFKYASYIYTQSTIMPIFLSRSGTTIHDISIIDIFVVDIRFKFNLCVLNFKNIYKLNQFDCTVWTYYNAMIQI